MAIRKKPVDRKARESAADLQLKDVFAKFALSHARLIAATRKSLRTRLPGAFEIVYEYRNSVVISVSPTRNGYDGLFAIKVDAAGVGLYFNQVKGLPDPAELLKGSGKPARSINLTDKSTLNDPEVARLIDLAIANNSTPFELDEKGEVLFRPARKKVTRPTDATGRGK